MLKTTCGEEFDKCQTYYLKIISFDRLFLKEVLLMSFWCMLFYYYYFINVIRVYVILLMLL